MKRLRTISMGRRAGGFVLLEVIVSMVILGIAIATIMRSFTVSMAAIRKNDVSVEARVMAQTVLQLLEAEPPQKGTTTGDFADAGFPEYSWKVETDEEEIKYKNLDTGSRIDSFRKLKKVHLTVTYDNGRMKEITPVAVNLILPPIERFTFNSKFHNELFRNEEGI